MKFFLMALIVFLAIGFVVCPAMACDQHGDSCSGNHGNGGHGGQGGHNGSGNNGGHGGTGGKVSPHGHGGR